MRKILFRGKRTDNGEWAEGHLYVTHKGTYEIGYYSAATNIERLTYIVDPNTVGQFTGLLDKNGKRIFEGDVLKVHSGYWDGDTYITKVWAEGATLCVYVQGEDYDYTAVDFADDLWSNTDYEPEVIGNIHDNPELLEGGDSDG